MKGTYVLLMRLDKDSDIAVGSLGITRFREGFYAYVGSGQGSLERRMERHFAKEKTKRWHIDYLLDKAEPVQAVYFESGKLECDVASKLSGMFEQVKGFGCSDCGCKSHLFYSEKQMEESAEKAIRSLPGRRSLRRWVRRS